jgi:hypothetical protein
VLRSLANVLTLLILNALTFITGLISASSPTQTSVARDPSVTLSNLLGNLASIQSGAI